MSKASKNTLGILTFLPYALLAVYFFSMTFLLKDAVPQQFGKIPFPLMTDVVWMLFILLLAGLLGFGLLIYYIVHVVNNTHMDRNEKMIWVILMILLSGVFCPVYWYMKILKTHDTLTMSAT